MIRKVPLAGRWRRSSHCDSNACVEAVATRDGTWVRSSADPSGTALFFSRDAWRVFLIHARERKLIRD